MATNITAGLFGIDPYALQQQQQTTLANQALQYASLSGAEQGQYGAYLGGGMAGQAFKGMMGIEDPQMKKAAVAQQLASQFDITTADGLRQYAQALAQNGAPDLAQMAVKRADEMSVSQATVAAKMREKVPGTGEVVNQALYADALRRAGGDPIKAAQIYDQEEQLKRRQVAAAGAPPAPGQVPLTVIKQAQDIVNEYTAAPKKKLDQISVLATLGEGVKTNPTLLPKFQQESVRFAGDNQVSAKEVARSLGSMGFASDVVDGVNSFLEGKPTNVKIDKVLEGMAALQKVYADQYNTGRNKASTVLKQGNLDPETQNAILPAEFRMPGTAPSLNTWLTQARAANPGTSDADLTAYYNKKYPKGTK
jgi:hypothetical protein